MVHRQEHKHQLAGGLHSKQMHQRLLGWGQPLWCQAAGEQRLALPHPPSPAQLASHPSQLAPVSRVSASEAATTFSGALTQFL